MINIKPFAANYEFFQIVKPLGKSINLRSGETVRAEVIDILPTGGVVLKMKGGILTVETHIPLQKDTSLLLKVLNTPSSDQRLKIQIIGLIDKSSVQIYNLQNVKINDLVSFLSASKHVQDSFLSYLISTLKNIHPSKENVPILIQLLSAVIKQEKTGSLISANLKGALPSINSLEPSKLLSVIVNSGLFFENKIKKRKLENISEDVKFRILSENSKDADKLLKTVEAYQYLSKMTEGIYVYLPFVWEGLKRGDLFFKRSSKGKNFYFCRIDLDFKNFGKIIGGIFLFESDLYVNFFVEDSDLKEKMRKSVQNLVESIKSHGFRQVQIKFLKDMPDEKKFIYEDFVRFKV